jgi:hypothetical protein
LATKKRPEGDIDWAVIGLMAFSGFFKSLLGCLCKLDVDVLLNNISKFHPNLTLIGKD